MKTSDLILLSYRMVDCPGFETRQVSSNCQSTVRNEKKVTNEQGIFLLPDYCFVHKPKNLSTTGVFLLACTVGRDMRRRRHRHHHHRHLTPEFQINDHTTTSSSASLVGLLSLLYHFIIIFYLYAFFE